MGRQFDVTNVLLWTIVIGHSVLLGKLMWDMGGRLRTPVALYAACESIPLAASIPLGYTPCYCAFPMHFDVLLYLAVGLLLLIVDPKMLILFKKGLTLLIKRVATPRHEITIFVIVLVIRVILIPQSHKSDRLWLRKLTSNSPAFETQVK